MPKNETQLPGKRVSILEFFTLVVLGFTACVEFGSYAFFHPVLRRLDPASRVRVEQGLLKTVGRAIPVLVVRAWLLLGAFIVLCLIVTVVR